MSNHSKLPQEITKSIYSFYETFQKNKTYILSYFKIKHPIHKNVQKIEYFSYKYSINVDWTEIINVAQYFY